jgi:hypothetical protein
MAIGSGAARTKNSVWINEIVLFGASAPDSFDPYCVFSEFILTPK